ncbi:MAG TPA: hypothetical protein VKT77_17990 [Chthonomonadaceae bacterium]|nr:hypothetical protein [Chthonomonadaceae bacterium]
MCDASIAELARKRARNRTHPLLPRKANRDGANGVVRRDQAKESSADRYAESAQRCAS